MISKFVYEYHFLCYTVFRIISFDGLKWCLTAYVKYPEGDGEFHKYESRHFTKETLSREFYEKFPECRSSRLQSVKKIFTND